MGSALHAMAPWLCTVRDRLYPSQRQRVADAMATALVAFRCSIECRRRRDRGCSGVACHDYQRVDADHFRPFRAVVYLLERPKWSASTRRSEEHTSELQS